MSFPGQKSSDPIFHFIDYPMFSTVKNVYCKLRGLLPQNKLRADYNELMARLKILESQVETGAQQLEVAKSSFLKNVYHEIRTPLNSVVGFANLLNRDKLVTHEDIDEYTALINKGSRDFLRIMDDIIQASLLEAGMININCEKCNIKEFFDENHAFFSIRKHIAEKNSVAILLSLDEVNTDIDAFIDKFRVTQVLTHLIDNALKYTEKGIVEYGCVLKGDFIEFFVKDSSAINLEGQEKMLFSKFSKVDGSGSEKRGLGLGLAISKSLVQLMGGDIWCASNGKQGSTFYFTIPMLKAQKVQKRKVTQESRTILDPVLRRHSSLAV